MGLQSPQGLPGERPMSKLTHVVVGKIQFLLGVWAEDLSSSLAVGWRSPSAPCQGDFSIQQLTTWQLFPSKQAGMKSKSTHASKQRHLNSPVTSHPFCLPPFTRSKSLGAATLRRRECIRT